MKFGKPRAEIILNLHKKGNSPKLISQTMGIPLYRVQAILKFADQDIATFDKVMKLKRTGMTDSDIARDLGMSKQVVSRLTPTIRLQQDKHNYKVRMDTGEWMECMRVAEEFGLIAEDGAHAGRGSVVKLLQQIGRRNLMVMRQHFPDDL